MSVLKGKTALEVMVELEAWAVQTPECSVEQLWHILTALRGPDFLDTGDVKWNTTCRIRTAVCPHFATIASADVHWPGDPPKDMALKALAYIDEKCTAPEYAHFAWHIAAAVRVILRG